MRRLIAIVLLAACGGGDGRLHCANDGDGDARRVCGWPPLPPPDLGVSSSPDLARAGD